MGTRETEHPPLWIATSDLPMAPGHPFYARLNAILDAADFDRFVETQCAQFYAPVMGRPSLTPGRYFRLLLVGYFEGIDSERGIAWRAADSLAVRSFLGLGLDAAAPDHSTISRTRRLIDVDTHRAVFTWVQERLVEAKLLRGKTVAIDATTLEANAAMRSIVRRDSGEGYVAFLTRLAEASGIKTPTREALARFDRRRKKKGTNKDWVSPSDADAKITKMKDGRTHLAHKAEHAIDLETGALLAVTLQGADQGDTSTLRETLIAAAEQIVAARVPSTIQEVVADKGYHSNETLTDLAALGTARLVGRAAGQAPGARQPSTDPRRPRQATLASAQRTGRASVRPRLRYRRDATHASVWPSQHLQATDRARQRVQSGAAHARADRCRQAPAPPGLRGGARGGLDRRLRPDHERAEPAEEAVDAHSRNRPGGSADRAPVVSEVTLATGC